MLISKRESQICQRRVLKEFTDIINDPIPHVHVTMDQSNNLLWYCLINNLNEEDYRGGEYIFHIKLSPRYPFEPPDFYMFTPNGRFATNTKLCFSNSTHHKESWSPIWNLRTIIMGFLSFFLEKKSVGIGHLESKSEEVRSLAANSKKYNQESLTKILELFHQKLKG
jgi:ubiquitin-conjugating enzyme E2 J2